MQSVSTVNDSSLVTSWFIFVTFPPFPCPCLGSSFSPLLISPLLNLKEEKMKTFHHGKNRRHCKESSRKFVIHTTPPSGCDCKWIFQSSRLNLAFNADHSVIQLLNFLFDKLESPHPVLMLDTIQASVTTNLSVSPSIISLVFPCLLSDAFTPSNKE